MENYTLLNFLDNWKKEGFSEAFRIDGELTAERNPYLARVHKVGKGFSKDVGEPFHQMAYNPSGDCIEKVIGFVGESVGKTIGYMIGSVLGAVGLLHDSNLMGELEVNAKC